MAFNQTLYFMSNFFLLFQSLIYVHINCCYFLYVFFFFLYLFFGSQLSGKQLNSKVDIVSESPIEISDHLRNHQAPGDLAPTPNSQFTIHKYHRLYSHELYSHFLLSPLFLSIINRLVII